MTMHEFNGQPMTTAQIRELVPCLRSATILNHLKHGRNTTDAMLCYVPPKAKPKPGSQFVIGHTQGFKRAAVSNMR